MSNVNWIDFYLLNVNRTLVSKLMPVTSTDTYVGVTKNFHPQGLYSTEIFGPVGSDDRDRNFAYIDVGIPIISPVVALALFELKKLYKEICAGTRHAVWDEKNKDFEPADPSDPKASTGYRFFLSHYAELKPKETASLRREDTLEFFNKHRDISLSPYVLVWPAGNRDLMVGQNGEEKEEEIGGMYRKLITLARAVPQRTDSPLTDPVRWKLQEAFNAIYQYFFDFLNGKRGYMRGKVTSRKLMDGTRNVLSSFSTSSNELGAPDEVRSTDTRMGLYQGLKALLPVAQYCIRERYLANIKAGDSNLYGINAKTWRREFLTVDSDVYDLFTTDEGVERLINRFTNHEVRHKPVHIDKDHYIALVYQDKQTFKVFYDIDELPEHLDKKNVAPMTLAELLYLSGYDRWNDYFAFITRYPVTGPESTYSSTIRLETTAKSSMKWELGDDWTTRSEKPAISFPRKDIDEFLTSMAPHPSRLSGMKGD